MKLQIIKTKVLNKSISVSELKRKTTVRYNNYDRENLLIYHKCLSKLLQKHRFELFDSFSTVTVIHNGYGLFKEAVVDDNIFKANYIFSKLKTLVDEDEVLKIEISKE